MLSPVTAVLLGLLVAAAFGTGDFLGGRASQSASTPGVLLMAQSSAVVGAIIVTIAFSSSVSTRDLVFGAIAAGLGFGTSFIFYAETSSESGNWPVLAARISAVTVVGLGVLVLSRRQPIRFPQGHERWIALGAGAFDVTGTTLLLVAVRHG